MGFSRLRRFAAKPNRSKLLRQVKDLHAEAADQYVDLNNMDFDVHFKSWNDYEDLEQLLSEVSDVKVFATDLAAYATKLEKALNALIALTPEE